MQIIPKVLSFNIAVKPQNGIVAYGEVQSRSNKSRKYTVTKDRQGNYHCSCKPGMFGSPCAHANAFKDRERKG